MLQTPTHDRRSAPVQISPFGEQLRCWRRRTTVGTPSVRGLVESTPGKGAFSLDQRFRSLCEDRKVGKWGIPACGKPIRKARFRGWLLTGSIAFGLPLALLLFHPDIEWYVGFSGVLHGLVVAGALLSRSENPVVSWLILIGITSKLVLEIVRGGDPHLAEFIDGPILIHAHVYGALLGGLCALTPDTLQDTFRE